MLVAIDGRALTGRYTGDRTYWKNLLQRLPTMATDIEFIVLSRTPIDPDELPTAPNLTAQIIPASNDRLWTAFALPRALRKLKADLVHVQYTVPLNCPCPVVTTVHDISFRIHPQWFPLRHRILLNLTVPIAMRRAKRVITVSESSRKDILRLYKLPKDRVVGILHGLPDGFGLDSIDRNEKENISVLAKYNITPNTHYVLTVGVLQPRKNLMMLAEAFGRARKSRNLSHSLVIAGKVGWGTEQQSLRDAAAVGGGQSAADALIFAGYVEDADLPFLYRGCDLFAYPSLYEGFGLPPLEAMACGAPVVVSDAPALPEVVGSAAEIVPARDTQAWSQILGDLLTDDTRRHELASRGPGHAGSFNWNKTAKETLHVFLAAIEKSQ